jgi:hypothetical protein
MAIINSYTRDTDIKNSDVFIGTKFSNRQTVNFTAQTVADYLNINGKISIAGQMLWKFVVINPGNGTMSFEGGGGEGEPFEDITELILSKTDGSGQFVNIFLDYLVDTQILLSQQSTINQFGHYKIVSYAVQPDPNFYKLTLEFIGGNGGLIKDAYYDMASFSIATGSDTIPTLQQVTTAGETTNVGIKVIGLEKYISVASQDNETGAVTISTDVDGLPYIQLGLTANENTATFRADNINTNSVYQLPNASGTIALTSDIPTQGLTSVGLTMPLAFNVANSPLTSNGTLAVTALGTASQYIRGDGQLAAFPSTGGGGSSVNYYLNGSIPSSVVGYQQMDNDAVMGVGTDFSLTGNGLISQFLTDVGNPNRLEIPGGVWNFEMFFSMSSNGGSPKFYVELLKYNGAVFTSIASSSLVPETISGGTAIDLYLTSLAVPTTPLLVTDRLAIRVYIVNNSGGRTAKLHTEDSHLCEIITTFSGGVTSLNGLTANTQYLAVGTSGVDFNINSTLDTHTFNIPNAEIGISRGLITNIAQSIDGSKTFVRDLQVSTLTIGKGTGNIVGNTAIGTNALKFNVSGANNTFIGENSGYLNGLAASNVGVGINTLYNNSSALAIQNTAVGSFALQDNTSGYNNTAFGYFALNANTTAYENTAIGKDALKVNLTGNRNTAVGNGAMIANTSGLNNVALGKDALVNNTTGNYNVAIGNNAQTLLGTNSNSIVIGRDAIGLGTNTVVIGNTSILTTRLSGNVLINTTTDNGVDKLQVNGSIIGTALKLSATPSTSAGTYDILTRNISTGAVERVSDLRKYKVYTALISQISTAPPSITILENTIGTVFWSRIGIGSYLGTLTGAFTAAKTYISISNGFFNYLVSSTRNSNDSIIINAGNDGEISNASIEIRVYN